MSASIASQQAYMFPKNDDCDFPLYPEAAPHPMYSSEFYHIGNMQGYDIDASAYGYQRTAQDPYPAFTGAPMYEMAQAYATDKHSPHLLPVGSPEVRPPPSNISTASGPSASSSTMGSPYSSHGQPVPIPEWTVTTTGLGIQPGIVPYGDFPEYNYGASGIDDQFVFTDLNKPGFVGECAKLPESASRPLHSFPSSISTLVTSNDMNTCGTHPEQARSDGSTPRLTRSPIAAVTPSLGSNDYQFKSPATPASATSPLSTRRFSTFSIGSASSAAGRTQDARSSPIFQSSASLKPDVAEQPPYSTYHQSPFFSQTSGQFVAPLESLCLFFLCHSFCT
jgi:hypothetical protein